VQQTVPDAPAGPDIPPSDAASLREIGVGIAATCAGFNLRRASRAVTQHFDHALAPVGLRTTQFTLLGALALAGPVSINELAHGLVVDRTTLTRNLKLLRDAGLVESRAPQSGREIRFLLSEAGRETLARAIPHWRAAQQGIEAAFGAARWPGMVAELDRLVSGTLALGPNGSAPPVHPGGPGAEHTGPTGDHGQAAAEHAGPTGYHGQAAAERTGPGPGRSSHGRPEHVIGS
jgi:DNA-binding MarR family transcriptional regulator